jgi:hypothetical protein
MLEPGMKWRAEPLIAMAKIYKAFRPNKFYLGELISITEEYWQQRRLKGGAGLSEKDEMKLALQIIENKLNINSSEISQSRVLAYTSAAIEEKLASNFEKDYFTNSAHKGKIRQAAQDIQVMLAGVSDLQTKLSEAKKFADQVKKIP